MIASGSHRVTALAMGMPGWCGGWALYKLLGMQVST